MLRVIFVGIATTCAIAGIVMTATPKVDDLSARARKLHFAALVVDTHENLAKPAVRHSNCNTESKTFQSIEDLGRPMRICGLLTRRHHQSTPLRASNLPLPDHVQTTSSPTA